VCALKKGRVLKRLVLSNVHSKQGFSMFFLTLTFHSNSIVSIKIKRLIFHVEKIENFHLLFQSTNSSFSLFDWEIDFTSAKAYESFTIKFFKLKILFLNYC
jgi:hypothetical protein